MLIDDEKFKRGKGRRETVPDGFIAWTCVAEQELHTLSSTSSVDHY